MKEKKKFNKEVEKKPIIIICVLTVIFIAGMLLVMRGCINASKATPKYYEIETEKIDFIKPSTEKVSLFPYYKEITLYYFINEPYTGRKAVANGVSAVYNKALEESFRLLDSNSNYWVNDDYLHNLTYINAHPNEEIVVDDYLYQQLKRGLEYSTGIYNIYAGNLYDYWTTQFIDSDFAYNDPLNNPQVKEMIDTHVLKVNSFLSDSSLGLKFNDTNKSVKLVITDDYKDYIKVDFQYLINAMGIEYADNALKANGYTNYYLSSSNGFTITSGEYQIGNDPSWHFKLSTNSEEIGTFISPTPIKNVTTGLTFGGYELSDEETSVTRSIYYDARVGFSNSAIESLSLYTDSSLVDLAYQSLYLMNAPLDQVKEIFTDTISAYNPIGVSIYKDSQNHIYVVYNKDNTETHLDIGEDVILEPMA